MITILAQSSLIILGILLIYHFLLEKETHYALNRWILFSSMLLAFILPQLELNVSIPYEVSQYFMEKHEARVLTSAPRSIGDSFSETQEAEIQPHVYTEIQETSEDSTAQLNPLFTWQNFLMGIYLLGAFFMLARFILNLLSLLHHIQILPKEKLGKYTLLKLQHGQGSYSFFNYLFINSQKLDHSTLSQVLSHEGIHADQKHSIDILLSELLIIVLWFNPFAWMYKKKVKQNLEYLTDELMLQRGADKTAYQFSLLRVSASGLASQLVLNYSQSLLKKRILMMNTKKSSFLSSWKYASLLPLLITSSIVLVAEKAPEVRLPEVDQQILPAAEEIKTEESPKKEGLVVEKAIIPFHFPSHTVEVNSIEGRWEAKIKEEEVCMRIIRSFSDKEWNWMTFDCYEKEDFSPAVTPSSTSFNMERKAGKIAFQGSFIEMKGEGDFSFTGNEAYRQDLIGKGIKNVSENLLFRIFSTRNEEKFVSNIIALNKLDLDDQSLESLMVDGVKAELVQGYMEEGVSVSGNLAFLRSRVKAKLLKSYMDADLDLEEHRTFINSRVKSDLLIAYKEAGYELDEQKHFINSRVKPSILKEYEEAGLDLEENRQLINSRIKASMISEYQEAGLDLEEHMAYLQSRVKPSLLIAYKEADLDLEKNKSFIQSRVKPELLLAYKELGLDPEEHKNYIHSRVKPTLLKAYEDADLDLGEYKAFIQSRVKPELLIGYKEAGLDLEENKSFIYARVKPSLLASYQEAGLDVHTYKSFIHSRVDASLLTSYQEAGLDLETHKKFIHSRVKASMLKKYQDAGYDLDTYRKYIQSRVSADFLKEYTKAGFDPLEYEAYVHNRIRPQLLKEYREAGLDIEEHKDFIMDRVSADKVLKYREAQKKKN
ncbi:MAG: M56 family metallopeptidase [Bacteroidota bacterium]